MARSKYGADETIYLAPEEVSMEADPTAEDTITVEDTSTEVFQVSEIPELVYTKGEIVCHPCVHTCVPDYVDF